MAKEALEVAGELQKSGQPELAALIYCMLGESFTGCCQYVKGMELMQLAKTLAVDADDRPMMARGHLCTSQLSFQKSSYLQQPQISTKMRATADFSLKGSYAGLL